MKIPRCLTVLTPVFELIRRDLSYWLNGEDWILPINRPVLNQLPSPNGVNLLPDAGRAAI